MEDLHEIATNATGNLAKQARKITDEIENSGVDGDDMVTPARKDEDDGRPPKRVRGPNKDTSFDISSMSNSAVEQSKETTKQAEIAAEADRYRVDSTNAKDRAMQLAKLSSDDRIKAAEMQAREKREESEAKEKQASSDYLKRNYF